MSDLLVIDGLTKAYPGVVANDGVSLAVAPGRIHALLGENGAGKSTLVKIIYGLAAPDAGRMFMRGREYSPASPSDARRSGVAMVFQHFSLFDALTVAENVALGMEDPPPMSHLARRIRGLSEAYGLPLDPGRVVGGLSAGERQRVEIARCLIQDPDLLIMDEPTSVLTPREAESLFSTLRKLSSEGAAILYISHKLGEIRALCDGATVLRRGKVVASRDPKTTTEAELAALMVGGEPPRPGRAGRAVGAARLVIDGLAAKPLSPFGTALKDIRAEVRAGEILGVGGVAGNGQDEFFAALSGETASDPAAIRFDGAPIGRLGPNARRGLGILCAPEERLGHAAAPDMSLVENAALTGMRRENLTRRGFIDWRRARSFSDRIIERFDVRAQGSSHAARSLSGGNLQKFVIGREILQRPEALVANQPTWGVDAAAAAAIRQAILDLADRGAAILVISQDLDELLEISTRFAALNGGRLGEARAVEGLTMERIGLMMGGSRETEAERADSR